MIRAIGRHKDPTFVSKATEGFEKGMVNKTKGRFMPTFITSQYAQS